MINKKEINAVTLEKDDIVYLLYQISSWLLINEKDWINTLDEEMSSLERLALKIHDYSGDFDE